jgi:alkyl sulfatase BDS1-like metallo-beta-lactamase superfamily hydrolase
MADRALSAKDYFEVVLPTMLRWKGPAAAALGVNVRFNVTGRGGGTWTIRLRPPVAAVVAGSEWKADLTIKITSDEMTNILAGTFDARKAIMDGNIELTGDLSVLKRVGFLFQSGGSEAEIRARTSESVPAAQAVKR